MILKNNNIVECCCNHELKVGNSLFEQLDFYFKTLQFMKTATYHYLIFAFLLSLVKPKVYDVFKLLA